eukprot:1789697-Rhodomonas_salina.1
MKTFNIEADSLDNCTNLEWSSGYAVHALTFQCQEDAADNYFVTGNVTVIQNDGQCHDTDKDDWT